MLYCEEKGDGFPLILLHGNGEDHTYFKDQIRFFSEKYRVIAIDTRGHGQSPRGDGEFSLSRFADDLYAFMIERKIENAHLLGFSDGGNIALLFALKHPERVCKLILNGANLDPSGLKKSTRLPIELGYFFARLFEKKSDKAKQKAEMLRLMVNEPHISVSELKKLRMPVLVIAGTKDMIKEKHTRLIADSIEDSCLIFEEGDHFIASKRPEAFNSDVESFLKG